MTSRIVLGDTPPALSVHLVVPAPFAAALTADAPFPAAPELVLAGGTVLPSTLDDASTTAAWVLTADEVTTLAATLAPRSRAVLRDPGTHQVWAVGNAYLVRVPAGGEPSAVAPAGSVTVESIEGQVQVTYVSTLAASAADGVITITTQEA